MLPELNSSISRSGAAGAQKTMRAAMSLGGAAPVASTSSMCRAVSCSTSDSACTSSQPATSSTATSPRDSSEYTSAGVCAKPSRACPSSAVRMMRAWASVAYATATCSALSSR